MPPLKRHPRGKRAFTVLELLAGAAVAAVLLGMLLAAQGRARKSGEAIACAANLRQLGLGITRFVADHGGALPPVSEESYYPGPVFGKAVPDWGANWGEYLAAVYFEGDKSLLRCPSRPATFSKGSGNYIDYGYNQRLCPLVNGVRKGLKLTTLPRPANTILLADAAFYANGVARSGFYRILSAADLHPRHAGSTVNVLYLDQHIERLPLDLAHPPADGAPLGRDQFLPQ